MKISAIFDNVDSAEHALFQLRSMGMEPRGYRISRLDLVTGSETGNAAPSGRASYENGIGAGGYTGLMGGVWNSVGWNNGTTMGELTEDQLYDSVSREVRLTVECAEEEADKYKGALVSAHGRQTKTGM